MSTQHNDLRFGRERHRATTFAHRSAVSASQGTSRLEVGLTLTAGMLIDQLSKQEQARVARALDKASDRQRAEPIRELAGGVSGQRTFSYPVGDLRIILTAVGNTIHVLDVAPYGQIRSFGADRRASR